MAAKIDKATKTQTTASEYIVRMIASLPDGTYIIEHPGGRLERRKGETDWDQLRKLTDEEIEKSIADDPDWAEFKDIDWSQAELVVPANKVAISIRLDPDVLDFFKSEGAGYQRRINAVLRAYMKQRKVTVGKRVPRKRA